MVVNPSQFERKVDITYIEINMYVRISSTKFHLEDTWHASWRELMTILHRKGLVPLSMSFMLPLATLLHEKRVHFVPMLSCFQPQVHHSACYFNQSMKKTQLKQINELEFNEIETDEV